MAFDYCTPADVFDYGNTKGNSTDPIDARAWVGRLITSVSRAIDARCMQAFSQESYVDLPHVAQIDAAGVLTISPACPVMAAPTAAAYRIGAATGWQTLTLADVEVTEAPHGAVVRFLGNDLLAMRFKGRITVRASYVGGYANLDALPQDLRLAAIAATWYEYTRRSAMQDTTAMPEMGIVIVPGDWPKNIRQLLADYAKVTRK